MLINLKLKRLYVALAVIFLFTLSISAPVVVSVATRQPYTADTMLNSSTFRATQEEPTVAGPLNDTSITYQTNITRNKDLFLTIVVGSDDGKTLNTHPYVGFALLFDAEGKIVNNASAKSVYSGFFLQVILFIPPEPEPGIWHFRLYLKAADGQIFASDYKPIYVTNAPPIIDNFTQVQIRGFTYSIVGINISVEDDSDLIGLIVAFSLYKPDGTFYKSNSTIVNVMKTSVEGIVVTVRVELNDWEAAGWKFMYSVTDREGTKTTKGPFTYAVVAPFVRSPIVFLTLLAIFTVGLVYAMKRFIK